MEFVEQKRANVRFRPDMTPAPRKHPNERPSPLFTIQCVTNGGQSVDGNAVRRHPLISFHTIAVIVLLSFVETLVVVSIFYNVLIFHKLIVRFDSKSLKI